MPNPVSIITWRDAKSDPPPTGEEATLPDDYIVLLHKPSGLPIMAYWSMGAWHPLYSSSTVEFDWWAERPVLSDLTDDDVRNVALWALDGEVLATGTHNAADRLRAALGGKEEA